MQSQNDQANKLFHARCSKGQKKSFCMLCLFVHILVMKIPKERKLPLFLAVKQHHDVFTCLAASGATVRRYQNL